MNKQCKLVLVGICAMTVTTGCTVLDRIEEWALAGNESSEDVVHNSYTQNPQTLTEPVDASNPAPTNVVDITAADRNYPGYENDYNADSDADKQDSFGAISQPRLYSNVQSSYKGRPLTKHIGDYVKNMAQDLISNMEYVSEKTPVAVTHFALLDSNLKSTNLLGQQMAESFIHELHKFRIPVLDFKTTDYIRITEHGDFALSRDYLELNSSLPIEYVLTGTMTRHQGGMLVNARIIGMDSHAVVASAQMMVPFYVVDALIPSDGTMPNGGKDGVRFTRG
ncbi:FlgO family outer membrane protein [Alteromonas sp. ASW11-130]|uniref:FlgO family outer membrane protein n=1 Tax=Alteromonas sp. ASW11-130 TaxID=3015775 RepID=UPI0022427449|nr:FlgO family outer membrane protein [Alteromonas sp. ASW11-130]MCW8092578.1 FlgO family outer membrane protein [Alteromonas sp. ASW11-130]